MQEVSKAISPRQSAKSRPSVSRITLSPAKTRQHPIAHIVPPPRMPISPSSPHSQEVVVLALSSITS